MKNIHILTILFICGIAHHCIASDLISDSIKSNSDRMIKKVEELEKIVIALNLSVEKIHANQPKTFTQANAHAHAQKIANTKPYGDIALVALQGLDNVNNHEELLDTFTINHDYHIRQKNPLKDYLPSIQHQPLTSHFTQEEIDWYVYCGKRITQTDLALKHIHGYEKHLSKGELQKVQSLCIEPTLAALSDSYYKESYFSRSMRFLTQVYNDAELQRLNNTINRHIAQQEKQS